MEFNATFILAAISFIFFTLIMNAILYKPLTNIIEQRKLYFEKNAKTAEDSKKKAQVILELKDKEIQGARIEASQMAKNALDETNKEQQEIILNVKNQAKADFEQALSEISTQCAKTKEELKGEIENFVNSIASKVLEKETNIRLDEEKINAVLNFKDNQNA